MTEIDRTRSPRRWTGAVAVALAAALAVSGCSSSSSIAVETVRGLPSGVTLSDDEQRGEQPVAIWTDDRATITVVTWGSSSCPPVPTALAVESAALLQLQFAPPVDEVCTADYAPTSHVLTTPDGVSFGATRLEMTFEAQNAAETVVVTVPIRDPE